MNRQWKLVGDWKVTEGEWNDWRWQIRNRITDVEQLSRFIEQGRQHFVNHQKPPFKKYTFDKGIFFPSTLDRMAGICPRYPKFKAR
ncbi:MAG: hypothetical protein M1119_07345 [Firmicutes bacterium]|nr:hypothetical protein [Bacillota bacterium]